MDCVCTVFECAALFVMGGLFFLKVITPDHDCAASCGDVYF